MLGSGIPYKFATPWAADATTGYITATIPATASGGNASQQLGFPPITAQPIGSGGIPPNVADFNGALNYLSAWAQWMQAGGSIGYDATFQTAIGGYPKGAILASATAGQQWFSTVDNNTTDPDTGGAGWIRMPIGIASGTVVQFTTNTTLTAANWGQFLNVGGGATIGIPAASAVPGMSLAFYGVAPSATIVSGGGNIEGLGFTTGTSAAITIDEALAVQSDGTSWRILTASPGFLGYATMAALSSETARAEAAEATNAASISTTNTNLANAETTLLAAIATKGPIPISSAGVGQWTGAVFTGSGSSSYITMPSGGTWAYFVANNGTGYTGIAAGGTNVAGPLSFLNAFGFCWRIA